MSSPEVARHQPSFVNQQHSGSDTHQPTSIESALMTIQEYMKNSHEAIVAIGHNISSLEERIKKIKIIQEFPTHVPTATGISVRERVSNFLKENKKLLLIGTVSFILCGAAAKYWKR